MATFSVTNTFVANTKAKAAEVNTNFSNVLTILAAHHHDPNIYTGASPITNSGIADNAQIKDTQLKSPITRSGLINYLALQYVPVEKGGTGLLHINLGDIIYASSANVFSTLGIGSAGQVLKVSVAGLPSWAAIASSKFGGTGADGALSISSGTTTLSAGNARYFEKNYSSVSITGTAALAFSNPHTEGTSIKIRSVGDVTVTSSANPTVDFRSMGGAGSTGNTGTNGAGGESVARGGGRAGARADNWWQLNDTGGFGGGGGSSSSVGGNGTTSNGADTNAKPRAGHILEGLTPWLAFIEPGGGGGAGGGGHANGFVGGTGGTGGTGGGAMDWEVGGNLNITSVFNGAGGNGTNGTDGTSKGGGGGGGGGGGRIRILYNGTLTANTATFTVSGGTHGTAGANGSDGSDGGAGESLVAANTYFT